MPRLGIRVSYRKLGKAAQPVSTRNNEGHQHLASTMLMQTLSIYKTQEVDTWAFIHLEI